MLMLHVIQTPLRNPEIRKNSGLGHSSPQCPASQRHLSQSAITVWLWWLLVALMAASFRWPMPGREPTVNFPRHNPSTFSQHSCHPCTSPSSLEPFCDLGVQNWGCQEGMRIAWRLWHFSPLEGFTEGSCRCSRPSIHSHAPDCS